MSNLNKKAFENKIEKKWLELLWPFLSSDEMSKNFKAIKGQKSFQIVYPSFDDCFKAFKLTPFDDVKVVIIGQDPYYDGSADGLAFSSSHSVRCPKALATILFEVEYDCYNGLNIDRLSNYDLSGWAKQGVLLLNTAFTVQKKKPDSHKQYWESFTKEVFRILRENHTGLVYLLWGNHAKNYKKYISEKTNHILEADHPANGNIVTSPFQGCKHFSKTNEILEGINGPEVSINWGI
jgi:uracil-DNA glycosylase